jgi:Na+/proline symporter
VLLGLYWKNMTRQGALAAMVVGFVTTVGCFLPEFFGKSRIDLFGLHPTLWGLFVSFAAGILVSKWTGPAPDVLIAKYFHQGGGATAQDA